jgi:hypothetical protein
LFSLQRVNSDEGESEAESKAQLWTRISSMACDFMLPEFKLVKKVTWSSLVSSEKLSDQGQIKNKMNQMEETNEENLLSSSSKQQTVSPDEWQQLTGPIGSKPNDIEKLSTHDSASNLLIVFDSSRNANSLLPASLKSNVFARRYKVNKFIRQNRILSSFSNKKTLANGGCELSEAESESSVDSIVLKSKGRRLPGSSKLLLGRKTAAAVIANSGAVMASSSKKNMSEDLISDMSDDCDKSRNRRGSTKKSATKAAAARATQDSRRKCFVTFQVVGNRKRDAEALANATTATAIAAYDQSGDRQLQYDDDTNVEIYNLSDTNNDTDNNEDDDDTEAEDSNDEDNDRTIEDEDDDDDNDDDDKSDDDDDDSGDDYRDEDEDEDEDNSDHVMDGDDESERDNHNDLTKDDEEGIYAELYEGFGTDASNESNDEAVHESNNSIYF